MVDSDNYFEILGLPIRFDLTKEQILRHYYQAIQLNHPDKLMTQNQSLAVEKASLINQAYTEISQPLKRAIYLLKLNNKELGENINNSSNQAHFLMEKMALYERLEKIETNFNIDELNQFQTELKTQLKDVFTELPVWFKTGELELIQKKIIACQFYQQILDKSENLEFGN